MTNQSIPPIRHPATLADARYGVQQSRRMLVDTLQILVDFRDAITVVGAHAVHVWVQDAWGPIDMQATRDADLAVNPVFVSSDPKLVDLMNGIGAAPALPDRPGIYGYSFEMDLPLAERTTIDLIVPEVYAGPGRRAARIAGQPHAASRAVGLELAVWDRVRRTLATFDTPSKQVDAWVAGPAALLVAKAHKVHERFLDIGTHPDRLRPKDSGDVALLMMTSQPAEIFSVMSEQSLAHPEISQTVVDAARWLLDMYGDSSTVLRHDAIDALADRFTQEEVNETMATWLDGFRKAIHSNGLPVT